MPDRRRRLESSAALAACSIAALIISWRLLRPDVFSEDAFVHQYWLWHFRDAALFNDPLTDALRDSARYPLGYQGLFWLAAQLGSPIAFGEWLGIALMALSGWLVWLIVRELTDWPPAPWLGAALFLALIDIHRFHGGFQRAFVHPTVLLCVLLALRERLLAAALVAGAAALVYPPAALLALGVLAFAAVEWSGFRPRLDRRRAAYAVLAAVLAAIPVLLSGGADVMTEAQARAFPEFNARGPLHFFNPSLLEYLSQNRSGFDLKASGSIIVLAAAAALIAGRPRLPRPVVALPVVALVLFGLAQAVLFKLYLPHRYTYPLVAFAAIAVAVALAPIWTALWEHRRRRLLAFAALCAPGVLYLLGTYAFPLGPLRSPDGRALAIAAGTLLGAGAAALLVRRPGAGALVCGLALLAAVLGAGHASRGSVCAPHKATRYLAGLPKDAIVAGDPRDLVCLPATARRAVVISTQLAPSYEPGYFRIGRERMFAMLRAYYGPSEQAIADLERRFGATHLWVRRGAIRAELSPDGVRWRERALPYGRFVRGLVRGGAEPATLRLPRACREWARGEEEIYSIECIRTSSSSSSVQRAAIAPGS